MALCWLLLFLFGLLLVPDNEAQLVLVDEPPRLARTAFRSVLLMPVEDSAAEVDDDSFRRERRGLRFSTKLLLQFFMPGFLASVDDVDAEGSLCVASHCSPVFSFL